METLALLLLVTMQRNSTGVVSVSMEVLRFPSKRQEGCEVMTAFGQTRHIIFNIINVTTTSRLKLGKFLWGHQTEVDSAN
jgi:hypothetical protein